MGRRIYPRRSVEERFWPRVTKTDGCWEWIGQKGWNGYGYMRSGGRDEPMLLVHRVSWAIHFGTIPDGMFVCHHCDNRVCVRPDHLFLGTNQDNMDDMWRKGRGRRGDNHPWHLRPELVRRGQDQPNAKLTTADVKCIRIRFAAGETITDIAACYPVTRHNVWLIVTRNRWASVGD